MKIVLLGLACVCVFGCSETKQPPKNLETVRTVEFSDFKFELTPCNVFSGNMFSGRRMECSFYITNLSSEDKSFAVQRESSLAIGDDGTTYSAEWVTIGGNMPAQRVNFTYPPNVRIMGSITFSLLSDTNAKMATLLRINTSRQSLEFRNIPLSRVD